jgi:WD40 repeat protein
LYDIAVNDGWSVMASGGEDGKIRIWQLDRETPLRTINAHKGRIRALALDAGGARLASSGAEGEIRIWSVASGASLKTLPPAGQVNALLFSGRDLIAGGGDGRVHVWDSTTGASGGPASQRTSKAAVLDLAMHPNHDFIAAACADQTVRLYDMRTGQEGLVIDQYHAPVRRVVFDQAGHNILGIDELGYIRIDPISVNDLMAAVRGRIQKLLTRDECMEYARAVPDACPPK